MAVTSSSGSQYNSHSDDFGNAGGGDRDKSNVREQDRFLLISNISIIIKKVFTGNAKIAMYAKEIVHL
ncbi:hypothetical protein MPTK1_8g04337 [Marchantia polymorpha subsp. ruderalis]|uniref:Uncharacterized protein n=1 Tax=Marchantia polymorpha TaxID=3197 RepID=A0A2R6VZD3_MARPO|nr:hypothetical protein MARPO_0257s0002 [Marchantia polymorpha]BBN18657.1 hypothetical protein Mp_8g04330 [Marchantia polymorpha subsp. ruderalis]|eukprot:PTQ26951.1 hypothetical protein MARPO_0257s0002 [Marchantia polymorpha]